LDDQKIGDAQKQRALNRPTLWERTSTASRKREKKERQGENQMDAEARRQALALKRQKLAELRAAREAKSASAALVPNTGGEIATLSEEGKKESIEELVGRLVGPSIHTEQIQIQIQSDEQKENRNEQYQNAEARKVKREIKLSVQNTVTVDFPPRVSLLDE